MGTDYRLLLESYGQQRSGRRRDDIAIIAVRFVGDGAERPGPGLTRGERGAPSVHLIVTDRRVARGIVV